MTDAYLTRAIDDLADMFTPEVVLAECKRLLGPVHPSTPSRVSDPDTSIESGDRNKTGDVGRFSARSRQAILLREFRDTHAGLTAYQAALVVMGDAAPVTRLEGCRRRVSDLRAAGYIEDSGERRQNVGSPDAAIVWKITLSGSLALDALDATGWSRPVIKPGVQS